MLKPNALIGRTVWSSPQRGESCHLCKFWSPTYPDTRYDPADQESYNQLVLGKCGNLRIMAAYKKVPVMQSYFYCSFYEEKEKGNGS